MTTEENLEPATVTLIVYRGIGLQPPKSKKKDSKKAKWKVHFCHGQDKKMSTMEVVEPTGNPIWDTTASIPVGNSYEPLVLLVQYRDTPVGQVIIPWTQVPDKAAAAGQPERLGELEGVKKNPDPAGAVYFNCWVDTYRPVQQQQHKHGGGLLKRLSLSRSKLSASSASVAEDSRRQELSDSTAATTSSSRKATVPTVKKLKRRLFHRGGGKTEAAAAAAAAATAANGFDSMDRGGGGGVSKAVSMGNLSAMPGLSMADNAQPARRQLDLAASSSLSPSPFASPSPSPASARRHPMARPQSLHNLALEEAVAAAAFVPAAQVAMATASVHQQQQLQLSRSRSAACLFAGPTYPSVDTDRPLPEVTEIEPDRAPAVGGQRVTVRGVDLALSAADLIGASLAGVPCRAVAFVSPEEVLLTAGAAPAAGAVGPVELVTVSAGCVRSDDNFTYTGSSGGVAMGGLPPPHSAVARSPSLCYLPATATAAAGMGVSHAKSNSLEGSPQQQPPQLQQPKPKPQVSKSPNSGNMKKSRSVWDMRLGRRGSDASNGVGGQQQQQHQLLPPPHQSSGSKLRKRDSGKGTLTKKQLLQESEALRAQLEAAREERARLASALVEAERIALEAEQRALEAEARARLDAESYDDRMLELTNFIDGLQARIIESGHVELLEKSPGRPPRC